MSTDADTLQVMLQDILQRESRLNDWELGFIDDISDRIDAGTGLSQGQDDTFTGIWERVTS